MVKVLRDYLLAQNNVGIKRIQIQASSIRHFVRLSLVSDYL